LALFTEPLARVALAFTPPAYFALGILGLSVVASLSGGSLVKGLIAALLGLMIATVGTDPVSGVSRFTAGAPELLGGIRPILVMVGLFAVSELMIQVGEPDWAKADVRDTRLKLPGRATWKRMIRPHSIGAVIGTVEGVTPGAGGTIAAFMSYNEAKRWSRHPEEFGRGSVEGVAAPEAANNVVTATALVPLLGLGIPGSNSAAILLGGFLIHGMQPGPMLFERNPEVVYALYGGLLVANGRVLESGARGGPPAALRLAQGQDTVEFLRVGAAAWSPAVSELSAFIGRYTSPEIRATWAATVENGRLVLSVRRGRSLLLTPVYQDAFAAGGLGTVWFSRDGAGRVTAMHISSARMWNLTLPRLD
ncbi:MAG: tripartite tricarboxylate transporter permease, partial [Gemmatimonadaceae bacterium]|nr:tripartite tricarboxylate transporter permease [Gemmatimonadaceae bacterium]